MALTAAMVAASTGGSLVSGRADRAFDGFSIDSRTVQPGDLFFAIVAARDGHAFVGDAIAGGARGAVVGPGFLVREPLRPANVAAAEAVGQATPLHSDADPEPVLIQVADTTRALQDLGQFVRRESGATVIAITGSAGKTTTKEAIATLLSGRYRVTKNRGNLNNHLGLPLSLLELRHGADVAVMELGMNHAGEIRRLVEIAEPEVRVWTNVGDAHIGYFASRDAIADAKAEILEHARPDDLLVCNADDARVSARVAAFVGRRVTFGESADADVRASAIEDRGLDGTRAQLHTRAGDVELAVPLIGRGNLANVLAAAAVALEMHVPPAEIAARAATLRAAPHRGDVLRLARGLVVVDDSYNSSPAALQRALAVLASESRAARKAAVLGEMLELGAHSVSLHEASGQLAAATGLNRLITVGGDAARAMAEAAIAAGMDAAAVTWTTTSAAAAEVILPWLAGGDVVLVKGSRGIGTDTIVARISAEWA
jgi:UDP-N-acetylmuramoyl-tripeptide--D-alanyl-D-alanine ligase